MTTLALRNAGGEELVFTAPYYLGRIDGLGVPPTQHRTVTGPYQHGATFLGAMLRPRVVTLGFTVRTESYAEKVARREELMRFFAGLDGTYQLVMRYDSGAERWLDVVFMGQLTMPTDPSAGPGGMTDVVQLIAYDPTWYDARQTVWAYSVVGGGFTFPVSFPVRFTSGKIDRVDTRQYTGTWDAYPIITIVGPARHVVIENQTLNLKLEMLNAYAVEVGETVTIDLRYGRKSATSSLRGNVLDQFTSDSAIGEWRLARHPVALNGRNEVRVAMSECTPQTRLYFRFNTRYIGL